MNTKHTAGPWRIVAREVLEDGSVYPTHIVGGERENQICMIETPSGAQMAVEKPDSIWNRDHANSANARLITAAPDLLAALQAYVAAEEERCGNRMPCYDMAVEALAKAAGGAQ